MTAVADWLSGFDLGAFLDVGLDTRQLGHLAGSLFLVLFGVSALRRVQNASGAMPALWIAFAIGLLAAGIAMAARGFPERVPQDLRPFVEPERLTRAAVVVVLLGWSLVLLSAHWARGRWARTFWQVAGLASIGLAVWLAAAWFGGDLPDEARPWTARTTMTHSLVVAGLTVLAGWLWIRPPGGRPANAWARRALAIPTIGFAALLGLRWFGPLVSDDVPVEPITRGIVIVAAIASGSCALIAGGAYCLTRRPKPRPTHRRVDRVDPPPPPRALPVAVLLDDQGRPVLPPSAEQLPQLDDR